MGLAKGGGWGGGGSSKVREGGREGQARSGRRRFAFAFLFTRGLGLLRSHETATYLQFGLDGKPDR